MATMSAPSSTCCPGGEPPPLRPTMNTLLHLILSLTIPFLMLPTVTATPVIDPTVNTSTPLRESMRSAHAGVTIHVQLLDFQSDYMLSKFAGFESLTGAKINPVVSTQSSWFDDVQEDIDGAGFIDLYAIFGNWIPTFADQDGFKDISDDVGANAVGLDWFDIMPAVRSGVASYQNKVYTVPLDGDVIVMLYRTDLVEGVGLPTPRSWDDVRTITEYYAADENKDFTGDGVADYANCFSSAENDIAGTTFWSIASTLLQTQGTSQGAFFNPETFVPRSSESIFLEALELYRTLVQSSPFRDLGEAGWQTNLAEFQKGRCVLWYNYPGPTRILVSQQESTNMTGVLNYAQVPGVNCNQGEEQHERRRRRMMHQCPFQNDEGISHAPFLASGGFSYAVNARSSEEEYKASRDFMFYISDPAVSVWDVAFPGSFLDPLRQSHTASLGNPESPQSQTFLTYGWEERQLPMLKDVTELNFLHDNYVIDLRILGANEYQEAGTVPHLVRHWKGERTAQQTADAITASWNAVTDKYGLREQRAMYRDTLGLAPYQEDPDPVDDDGGARLDVIIPLVIVAAVLIVVLMAIVLKQHHHIKYKTRDVGNAPLDGTVVVLFTDIEGSTSLWDASKSLMSKSLEIHHDVVRKCIHKHGAYEVETIGDAFMVATSSADAAVKIANDIQTGLLDAQWPAALATMPTACVEYFPKYRRGTIPPYNSSSSSREKWVDEPRPMFRGLRVRIGIHLGEHSSDAEEGGQIQIKYDKVTKGYDYYGPATNAAARIEALGFGGQTLISSAVMELLSDEVKKSSIIRIVGALELRGVSVEVTLYQCLPRELKGRRFEGVVRRRNSEGGSIIPDNDPSMHLKSLEDTDLTADIMSLTPVQLQSTVMRLRTRVNAIEENYRRLSSTIPSAVMDDDKPKESSVDEAAALSSETGKGEDSISSEASEQ